MKVLILAAGYAVRLYPLTLNTPKPLLEIGKRKIIDRILGKIERLEGTGSIYIITNDKFLESFRTWLKSSRYKKKISLINDGSISNETRCGAIKDLEIAIKNASIDDDLLVIAGDNLFELDLDKFLKFAKGKSDGVSIALYDLKDRESAKRFGVVEVDEGSRIIDFQEKPGDPKSTLVSTGIYYFPKEKLNLIKEYVMKEGGRLDAPGYYISWLTKIDRVYGFEFFEDWRDIGDIESLKKADRRYKRGEAGYAST